MVDPSTRVIKPGCDSRQRSGRSGIAGRHGTGGRPRAQQDKERVGATARPDDTERSIGSPAPRSAAGPQNGSEQMADARGWAGQ